MLHVAFLICFRFKRHSFLDMTIKKISSPAKISWIQKFIKKVNNTILRILVQFWINPWSKIKRSTDIWYFPFFDNSRLGWNYTRCALTFLSLPFFGNILAPRIFTFSPAVIHEISHHSSIWSARNGKTHLVRPISEIL